MIHTDTASPAPTRARRVRRRGLAVTAIAVLSVAGLAGCGSSSSSSRAKSDAPANPSTVPAKEVSPAGDIPDNQAFLVYRPAREGYSVKVPEGWAQTSTAGGTVFTDKLNSIRLERTARAQAPTPATVTTVDLPKLAKESKNFQAGPVSEVHRTAGNAVLLRYQADSAPDPVTNKVRRLAVERYEFWRSGQSVILTLSGPKGADNVDPWRIVTSSFGWRP